MATKLTIAMPDGGSRTVEVQSAVAAITQSVNNALKTSTKFVAVVLADGRTEAIVAADLISIYEEE
jgi:hypothetical protein